MPRDYFLTWSRQSGAASMAVVQTRRDEFFLADGRAIYDFVSTSFQAGFGHSCDPIRERIHRQLDEMPIASPKSVFAVKEEVSERLLRYLARHGREPAGKLFYTVSGSESVENALKIARHATGRPLVLSRNRSYHGASLGAMSVSGDWRSAPHLNFTSGTVRIPEPDEDIEAAGFAEVVERTGPDRIAAVIVETISGVNGVVIPPQSWWTGVSAVCRRNGILLVCDEVLAGFGRTGPPFAFHHFDVEPDMVTMSKGITGGYIPFGAVWVSGPVAARYDDEILACGLTNYAHPLGLAALDAVLDLLTDTPFLADKRYLESVFAARLNRLAETPHVREIRCRGLLAAMAFHDEPPDWQTCLDAGLYLAVTRDGLIVLAPPFVSTPARLNQAFDSLEQVLGVMAPAEGSAS